jgi:hypothetical protein
MAEDVIYTRLDVSFGTGRTAATVRANIAKIDTIISLLFTEAIANVANSGKAMYELDTGQTKTKVEYTDPGAIYKSIDNWEQLRQRYINMLSPSMVRLVDSKNFRG